MGGTNDHIIGTDEARGGGGRGAVKRGRYVVSGDLLKGHGEVNESGLNPSVGQGREVVGRVREEFSSEPLAFVREPAVRSEVGEGRFGDRFGGFE